MVGILKNSYANCNKIVHGLRRLFELYVKLVWRFLGRIHFWRIVIHKLFNFAHDKLEVIVDGTVRSSSFFNHYDTYGHDSWHTWMYITLLKGQIIDRLYIPFKLLISLSLRYELRNHRVFVFYFLHEICVAQILANTWSLCHCLFLQFYVVFNWLNVIWSMVSALFFFQCNLLLQFFCCGPLAP